MNTTDEVAFAWVVGLYEGEGTCYLTTNGRKSYKSGWKLAFVSIQMADREPLDRVCEVLGYGKVNGPYAPARGNTISRKPLYRWRVCAQREVLTFLEAAWPLLSQRRREQADPVIAYCKERLALRSSL